MIKNLAEIEKALGLKAGEFKSFYDDTAEKEIPLTDLEIIPKADYTTRIANIEKTKYDEGKLAGKETTIKEIRTEFGVDVSKKIDIKELKTVIETKVQTDAKIEPDKKVKQLEIDLGVMTGNFNTANEKATKLENDYKAEGQARTINQNIISFFTGKKTIIPVEEVVELTLRKAAANGITSAIDETGAVIFKKGDAIMKDKNLVALKADEALKDYFTPYITPASGGGGGGDNPAQGKPGSMEAFDKEMEDKKIKVGTPEYNKEMSDRIKAKTLTA